jgi:hypothetical protein
MMRAIQMAVACLAVLVATAGQVKAGLVFAAPSYNADIVFQDGLGPTTRSLAFDGANYWSSSGGGFAGDTLAQYGVGGNFIAGFSPGPLDDFRSVFSNSSGDIFALRFNSNAILKQTTPGTFVPFLTLNSAGPLFADSAIVLNGDESEYVALNNGTVKRWDLFGNFLGEVNLSGWGTVSGEDGFPENRRIAAAGDYWLTYNNPSNPSNAILSAWDMSGNRVDQTQLVGAGNSNDSGYSFSYANNRVFIVDSAGGNWRGFNVMSTVPEPSSLAIFGIGACVTGIGAARRRRHEKQQEATATETTTG